MEQLRAKYSSKKPNQNFNGRVHPFCPFIEKTERNDEYFRAGKRLKKR